MSELQDRENLNSKSNNKTFRLLLFIVAATSIFVPFIIYFQIFDVHSLSKSESEWNLFSQFVSGTVGPMISLWTLVITAWIAYSFNNYQIKQQKIKDSEQLQQTTIDLFKEIRSPEMRKARDKAREVRLNWDKDKDKNPDGYKVIFISAMINEKEYKDQNIHIEEEQFRAVYSLFTFYIMLGLYSNNDENIKNLNYFYYSWWRHFLYEIATDYDHIKSTISACDPILLDTKKFNKALFLENISLKRPLKKLDIICGFNKIEENLELHI